MKSLINSTTVPSAAAYDQVAYLEASEKVYIIGEKVVEEGGDGSY